MGRTRPGSLVCTVTCPGRHEANPSPCAACCARACQAFIACCVTLSSASRRVLSASEKLIPDRSRPCSSCRREISAAAEAKSLLSRLIVCTTRQRCALTLSLICCVE